MVLDSAHIKTHAQDVPAARVAKRVVDLVDVEAPLLRVGVQRAKVQWISAYDLKSWSGKSVLRQAERARISIGQPQLVDGPHADRVGIGEIGIIESEVDIGIKSGQRILPRGARHERARTLQIARRQ